MVRGKCGAWGSRFGDGCVSSGRRLGYVSSLRKRHLAAFSGQTPIVAPQPFRTSRELFANGDGSLALCSRTSHLLTDSQHCSSTPSGSQRVNFISTESRAPTIFNVLLSLRK